MIFKNEEYLPIGASNIYRTEDGKKIFYIDRADNPVWLYSDSPIHIELRKSEMMENSN